MKHTEQWIWLPVAKYGDTTHNIFSGFNKKGRDKCLVAEFAREYEFSQKVISASLRYSGDCLFQLFLNDESIATGPACVGGDFIGNDTCREQFYSFESELAPNTASLQFFARVKMIPNRIAEYSMGRGGFMLSAILTMEDGTQQEIHTDETWLARKNGAYTGRTSFDGRILADEYVPADCVENVWHTQTAPIPVRTEEEMFFENGTVSLSPREEKTVTLELDKIWAGFLRITTQSNAEVSLKIYCKEQSEGGSVETVILNDNCDYRGFYMHSAGNIVVVAKNNSDVSAQFTVSFIETHYPVSEECETVTSDETLNAILNTCKHTLKICRQTHHLDSPRHCEPLACTGDYYIESLMTLFSFGDMRLAEFDLIRTTRMLEREKGRLFMPVYSLIWVKMLYDVYMATGNLHLLDECKEGLNLLFRRFETYVGENGLVENPPDYMFIDWIFIDELSMHHPPKALGQTCMNMFYFGALDCGEKIFCELNDTAAATACVQKKKHLQKAINTLLFDQEKELYFMGLNTPEDASPDWRWHPKNTDKRYYLKHANILAAYFGICDDDLAKTLITKVITEEIEGEIQPYFLHYLLEAIYRLGLRDEYTLSVIRRWADPVKECPKGLAEGFVKPEPTYTFDHSHAWGGTPLYSLPKALMGFEITKPGMKEIKLSPSLLGLPSAKAELLTPFGKVVCEMQKGKAPKLHHPKEVTIILA